MCVADRSENMIKNEYMKLSRDASHRKLKSDNHHEVVDGISIVTSADDEAKKVWTRYVHIAVSYRTTPDRTAPYSTVQLRSVA